MLLGREKNFEERKVPLQSDFCLSGVESLFVVRESNSTPVLLPMTVDRRECKKKFPTEAEGNTKWNTDLRSC